VAVAVGSGVGSSVVDVVPPFEVEVTEPPLLDEVAVPPLDDEVAVPPLDDDVAVPPFEVEVPRRPFDVDVLPFDDEEAPRITSEVPAPVEDDESAADAAAGGVSTTWSATLPTAATAIPVAAIVATAQATIIPTLRIMVRSVLSAKT
jgi:hypothetical protein